MKTSKPPNPKMTAIISTMNNEVISPETDNTSGEIELIDLVIGLDNNTAKRIRRIHGSSKNPGKSKPTKTSNTPASRKTSQNQNANTKQQGAAPRAVAQASAQKPKSQKEATLDPDHAEKLEKSKALYLDLLNDAGFQYGLYLAYNRQSGVIPFAKALLMPPDNDRIETALRTDLSSRIKKLDKMPLHRIEAENSHLLASNAMRYGSILVPKTKVDKSGRTNSLIKRLTKAGMTRLTERDLEKRK